jgi:hypothetical protein
LLEALLVTVLFFLALSLIGTLFVYASRFTRSGGERTEIAESRLIAADTLRRAMAGSYQSGNTAFYQTPGSDDLVLSLISHLDSTGENGWDQAQQKPVFSGYLIFYLDSTTRQLKIWREEMPPSSTAVPLPEATLRTLIAGGPGRVLVPEVTTFQLFAPQDGQVLAAWSNPIGLRLIQRTSRGTPVATEIPFKFPSL